MTTEESELERLPNLQPTKKPNIPMRLLGWFKRKLMGFAPSRLREKVRTLTISQYFYFAAFIPFVLNAGDNYVEQDLYVSAGILAGFGLFRELWQLFIRVWDKMLGKGLLLILYAGTANFVLAVSAQKINAVVGIEPSSFVFTLGFTTFLMLPFWLLMSTVVFFSIATVVLNLWLLFSIMLRLVRIKIKVHWEDTSFVFLTMVLRLVLIPSVIMTLVFIAKPYVEQIGLFDQMTTKSQPSVDVSIRDQELISSSPETEKDQDLEDPSSTVAELGPDVDSASDEDADSPEKIRYLDIMIANFVFWFETYPQSKCLKEPQQRSLVIDENSMLIVEKDETELGFTFSVKPCIPVYEQLSETEKVNVTDAPNGSSVNN